ncbi:RHS repeat-associated core domain-containing protein, partial [Halopseudomonas yangmingensis]
GEAESLASVTKPEDQSLTLNLRFPGQYHDQESGLYYNYFRTYDPSKGRYTQSDPIGLMGGVNTFGYVAGNPLSSYDPYGLVMWTGTYRTGGFAAPGGATVAYFDLVSECVSGMKSTASVLYVGPTIGLGLEVSGAEGNIAFIMHRDDLSPWEFQGVAGVYSASIMGFGVSRIVLGNAFQRPVDEPRGFTIEIGAAVSLGSSTLTDFSYSSCGCGT